MKGFQKGSKKRKPDEWRDKLCIPQYRSVMERCRDPEHKPLANNAI
jgi:hypothetical protein